LFFQLARGILMAALNKNVLWEKGGKGKMNTARMAGFCAMKALSDLTPAEIKIAVANCELSPERAKELLKEIEIAKKIWRPFTPGAECSSSLW